MVLEADAGTVIGRYIDVLTNCLQSSCNPTRAPDRFDTSLKAACSLPPETLGRLWLVAGFKVWFAQFLATQRGLADNLGELAPSQLAIVAEAVAKVQPHETVERLFSHLGEQSWRGKDRQGQSNTVPNRL
jgi:hypothetical protein